MPLRAEGNDRDGEHGASTSGNAATYFKSEMREYVCNIVSKSRIIVFSSNPIQFKIQAAASCGFLHARFREQSRVWAWSVSDFSRTRRRGEKSEETRRALCATSRHATLPDFHRAKSPVAYHTSGRPYARLSMPRITPTT